MSTCSLYRARVEMPFRAKTITSNLIQSLSSRAKKPLRLTGFLTTDEGRNPPSFFFAHTGGVIINVYDIVTERILQKLKEGCVPWLKPWIDEPISGISGKAYTGVNLLILDKPGEYFTMKEIMRLRAKLKEKYTTYIICYYSFDQQKKGEKKEEKEKRSYPVLKYYRVYHISDIEGINPKVKVNVKKDIMDAEKIITGYTEVPIRHDLRGAFYSPSIDYVNVPDKSTFNKIEEYYCTMYHELAHSTGHKKRLNRFGENDHHLFGSETYSKEELIAELTACMLCGHAGIEEITINNSASYISSWISRLENDHHLIVSASSKARKASEYILGIKPEEVPIPA